MSTLNEELLEIFGTVAVSPATISNWKRSWRDNNHVVVDKYVTAISICNKLGISQLVYQFWYANERSIMAFYREEDMVLFRLANT